MLKRRPDLVRLLMSDWCVDRKGEIPPGKGPYYKMPVFHMYEGILSVIYARGFIQVGARPPLIQLRPTRRWIKSRHVHVVMRLAHVAVV
jgi:hypothetical protein